MKGNAISRIFQPAIGAALAALCGLLLWKSPLGEPWVNASYDYLFRFSTPAITNKVTLILMDNEAFDHFHQQRGQPWDRGLHAQLLDKLADDGCALVVFDSFFRETNNPAKDKALADAMRRQRNIVLMAEQAQVTHSAMVGVHPILPSEPFLSAAKNWGVAWLDPDSDSIVRRQWPFPSPGSYPSLAQTAAQIAGAQLNIEPREQWLRYYGQNGLWARMSYEFALAEPKNYFRDQIVFIGTQPQTSLPNSFSNGEPDKFNTPYTPWTGEASGGVEIMLTSFLNLVNSEWLQRPAPWIEALILIAAGIGLGGGLCRMRLKAACICAVAIAATIALGMISWSHYTNYWFPWLIISGAQMPCALAWAAALKIRRAVEVKTVAIRELPKTPGYQLFDPPFGRGAYGNVWLAQTADGQWKALKAVYLQSFENEPAPYEREFSGISRYKPISGKHPGLLRVDFVSGKLDGYFYYVMELGDSLEPDWQHKPLKYKPRDLTNERNAAPGERLSVPESVRIGIALADSLEFIHQQGLTHRDIKPRNVIFVNGQPKLADLGLVSEIRPADEIKTFVGTPGYMPPPPEPPGTPRADIYALGMLLYVISTGRNAAFFPDIATTLMDTQMSADFLPLNGIILKACHGNPEERYASAAEMRRALIEVQKIITTT